MRASLQTARRAARGRSNCHADHNRDGYRSASDIAAEKALHARAFFVLASDPIYISSMQAVVRQMRAQIGRCLFVPFMRGSPAAYVQLRPISSDLEKCRAIIAIRMPRTMPCRSRSAIADPVPRCRRDIRNSRACGEKFITEISIDR